MIKYLCGSDGLAEARTTLSGVEVLTANDLLGLLDNLLTLGQDELDVARVRHVGVDLRAMLVGTTKKIARRLGNARHAM